MADNGVEMNVHRVEVFRKSDPCMRLLMKTQGRGEVEASEDAGPTKLRRSLDQALTRPSVLNIYQWTDTWSS